MKISRQQAAALGLTLPAKSRAKTQPAVSFEAMCADHGLTEPVPEFRFHPVRMFRWDYCWPERMVALEVEGAIYGTGKPCPVCKRRPPGGHSSISGIKRDIEKANLGQELGWRVLRCLPEEIKSGEVFELLKRVLR